MRKVKKNRNRKSDVFLTLSIDVTKKNRGSTAKATIIENKKNWFQYLTKLMFGFRASLKCSRVLIVQKIPRI